MPGIRRAKRREDRAGLQDGSGLGVGAVHGGQRGATERFKQEGRGQIKVCSQRIILEVLCRWGSSLGQGDEVGAPSGGGGPLSGRDGRVSLDVAGVVLTAAVHRLPPQCGGRGLGPHQAPCWVLAEPRAVPKLGPRS